LFWREGFSSLSVPWKIFEYNSFSFLLLIPKFSGGIEEVSLMRMLKGLNEGGQLG